MNQDSFIKMMNEAKLYDLTQGCSVFTPPWPGEKALEVHFFKRVTGAYGGGQGANGRSNHQGVQPQHRIDLGQHGVGHALRNIHHGKG